MKTRSSCPKSCFLNKFVLFLATNSSLFAFSFREQVRASSRHEFKFVRVLVPNRVNDFEFDLGAIVVKSAFDVIASVLLLPFYFSIFAPVWSLIASCLFVAAAYLVARAMLTLLLCEVHVELTKPVEHLLI